MKAFFACSVSFLAFSSAFTVSRTHWRTKTQLHSDGNPPPFGNWGQPAAAPAPSPPAADPYANWGQPAAPAPPAADPYASWGQPAAPAATTPAPVEPAAPVVASSGDPIADLDAAQQAVVDKIAAAIPDMAAKPSLSWTGEPISGSTAKLDARDAPGSSNIAWFANLCIPGKLSSLTIFNGPLTDVPHLLSRCCLMDDNTLQVAVDIRPRAYGAYEMVDADGNYPGPEELGRKAFEYSGARNDFFTKFGTDSVQSLLDPSQFEGASVLPQSELDLLTGSPLALFVSMPATDANVAKVMQVRDGIALAWLSWALEDHHEHRPGAPVNTQYVYDSKFRQNAYSALLPYYNQVFGADGPKLAAGESGPLDEAYVGGGS